jgi:NhaP-type Na+/H+ or K+/H+ antiporter
LIISPDARLFQIENKSTPHNVVLFGFSIENNTLQALLINQIEMLIILLNAIRMLWIYCAYLIYRGKRNQANAINKPAFFIQ